MTQDLKCFFGIHKYQELERIEVRTCYGKMTKKIYVDRCSNCGKIHKKEIPYEPYI